VRVLYSGEVRGVASWNCNRLAATDFIASSIFQLPALLQVKRLVVHSSGTSDVSLLEGQARRHWARESWQPLVVSGGEGD
jgi:hypothetical protein